jgi:RecA/RadA recombinase
MIGAPSSTGKTYLAISSAKNFLHQNPDGLVFYFESESAISKDMLLSRGIDTKRTAVVPVVTVQDFRTQSLKILDNYEKQSESERQPLFFILDSMGNLSTTKEMEDSSSGKDTRDMTRAQLLKATFRVLTLRLGRAGIPLLILNHVYASMEMYAGPTQSGGSGAVYASSTVLTLTKAKDKDLSTNETTGAIITVTATKSRLTKENTKVKCLIKYDGGMSRYYGLLEIAVEAGAWKKVSTRFELDDGTKVFGKAINENPEKYFTPEVLEKINTYVKRVFSYGATGETPYDVEAVEKMTFNSNPDEEFTDDQE